MSKRVYTNDDIKYKNIFELRDLAKDVGIPSPTKLHKNQLIDMIVKISSGDMPAPVAPRRGRPPKAYNETQLTESKRKIIEEDGPIMQEKTTSNNNQQPKTEDRYSFDRSNQAESRKSNYVPKSKQKLLTNEVPTALSEPRLDDEERAGLLDIHSDGYGFLRVKNCEFNDKDVYVNAVKLRKLGLRNGDLVKGITRQMQDGKPAALLSVHTINGVPFEKVGKRLNFDELIPTYPDQRLKLELADCPKSFALRCIDLVAPIGKGQRAMIVSPPKAGKTTLLKLIASAISKNYPNVVLKVLLIDERPEEVTDMQRSISGEVIYSTFDEQPEHHTRAAELLLANAKRQVEMGKDVVILMDSLTRLARAYNMTIPPTGRTLSGGIDPGALHSPKKFFGAARNIENGGSLTIIATALVDTGSRMDDVIYEEFKGTGNMEIHLDRKLQEKRVFPAIDLAKSGTRKEELLLTQTELEGIWSIRKMLSAGDATEATENLLNMIVRTNSNQEFIEQLTVQQRALDKQGFAYRKPL